MSSGSIDASFGHRPLPEAAHPKPRTAPMPVPVPIPTPPPLPQSMHPQSAFAQPPLPQTMSQPYAPSFAPRPMPVPMPLPPQPPVMQPTLPVHPQPFAQPPLAPAPAVAPLPTPAPQPKARSPQPAPRPMPVPKPIPAPPKDKSVVDPKATEAKQAEESAEPRTWRERIRDAFKRREFVTTTISTIVHMLLIISLALWTIEAKRNNGINLIASPDAPAFRPDSVQSQSFEMPMVAAGPQVQSITAPAAVIQAPKNLGNVAAPKTVANLDSMIMTDSVKAGGAGGLDTVSFFGSTTIAKRVIFVVDNSQSMEFNNRWARAKEEIYTAVSNLSPQQEFYVFFFSDKDYPMLGANAPSKLVKLDAPMWEAFHAWVERLGLNGDTMAESALRKAYAMKPDVIYLMTDGEFFDNTVEFLMKMRYSKVRVNTIGFETSDPGREALKKIAETLKGEYTEVQ